MTNKEAFLRPSNYLIEANKHYPQAWKMIDEYIQKYRANWPNWCFLPMNANVFGISKEDDEDFPQTLSDLHVLAAWRTTQGIYRIDPDVLEPLWDTSISGEIPTDVLYRLPEWCVYIETGKRDIGSGRTLHGFFACLDFSLGDPVELSDCVVIFLDIETGPNVENQLSPYIFPLKIGPGISATIEEMIDIYMDDTGNKFYPPDPEVFKNPLVKNIVQNDLKNLLPRIFSLLIHLCAENSEIRSTNGKDNPAKIISLKNTKNGLRYFPPNQPTVWETAWRIGASIRSYREKTSTSHENELGEKKRPHIRRAHWHSYWIGALNGERSIRIKWLPPIPVNVDSSDDLIPVIRGVD